MTGCRGGDGPCVNCGECNLGYHAVATPPFPAKIHKDVEPFPGIGVKLVDSMEVLDALFVDYLRNNPDAVPSKITVVELMAWYKK